MKRIPLAFIFITIFVDVLGYSMILPLLPFFVQKQGGGAAMAGTLASLYAFLQLFSGPVLGSLSDRLGRKPILMLTVCGNCACYLALAFAPSIGVAFLVRAPGRLPGLPLTISYAPFLALAATVALTVYVVRARATSSS